MKEYTTILLCVLTLLWMCGNARASSYSRRFSSHDRQTRSGITLGDLHKIVAVTDPNIKGIVFKELDMASKVKAMAAKVKVAIEKQDLMFFNAGVDDKNSSTTRGIKAMFTAGGQKAMKIGESERIKTMLIKDLAIITSQSPMALTRSMPELLSVLEVDLNGLGTKNDNCNRFVNIRCEWSSKYRTADGSCNNLKYPFWGRAFIPMRRFLQPQYDDGVTAPRVTSRISGAGLPSARTVSQAVHPSDSRVREATVTHMLMQWGQFLDHDITSTPVASGVDGSNVGCCTEDVNAGSKIKIDMAPEERDICFPLQIEKNDPTFQPKRCMNFIRSIQISNSNCEIFPGEQMNQITAYIDGSGVYGSSKAETRNLRDFKGGFLRTSEHDLLPEDDIISCKKTKDNFCFRAGDGRVNEQMALATMHTVWMREHNRMAKELRAFNPLWNDEKLFQETRRIVVAKIQHITYNEFLKHVLNPELRQRFDLVVENRGYHNSYDEEVDPSIRNSFASAAYRFGHTLIRSTFSQLGPNYQREGSLMLKDSFGNTTLLIANNGSGIDACLRGLVTDGSARADMFMTPQVTQHLFEDPSGQKLDLAALNIQRGRDHGLPGYNQWRQWCGLPVARTFSGLVDHREEARRRLKSVYDHPDDIDLFAGGLSEESIETGYVGRTFACILAHQFKALRNGDRFWYERKNPLSGFTRKQLNTIKQTRLSRVLCDNTNIKSIQTGVFFKTNDKWNVKKDCSELKQVPLTAWSDDPKIRSIPINGDRNPTDRQQNKTPRNRTKDRYRNGNKIDSYGRKSNGQTARRKSKVVLCTTSVYRVFAAFLC